MATRRKRDVVCTSTWALAGAIINHFSRNLSTQTGPSVEDAIDKYELSQLIEKHAVRVALEIARRDSD